jgi:hypothetical protein
MSTPSESLPKKSADKQVAEDQKQKWSEFLTSFIGINEKKLPPIVSDIAKDSFEAAARTFHEVATYNYQIAPALGKKLSEALELKLIREEQIFSFFVQSLKLNSEFHFQQGLLLARICNATESNLGKTMLSHYLNSLTDLVNSGGENDAVAAYRELKRHLRSRTIIIDAYQSLTETNQSIFLAIFFSFKSIEGEILYGLKAANTQLFEKFCHLHLSENTRAVVNERLKDSYNPFISSLQSGNFDTAVTAFICHPASPIDLYNNLQRNKSKFFSEKEVLVFFSTLLENQHQLNMQFCFAAIRSCFESKRSRDTYPSLVSQMMFNFLKKAISSNKINEACEYLASKATWNTDLITAYAKFSEKEKAELLNNFMLTHKKNKNTALFLEFRKIQPDFFERILSVQDVEFQKTCRDALAIAAKENPNVMHEWTFEEEELLLSFNQFLENPSDTSKGFAFGMEKIGNILEGSHYKGMYPNLVKKLIELYIEKAIKLGNLKEVSELLASRPLWSQYILEAYQFKSKEHQEKLMHHFLDAATRKYNAVLLSGLRDLSPQLFDVILLTQAEEAVKTIRGLLTVPAPARLSISNLMLQFSLPFREIMPYAAKIVCSEINQRKRRYFFLPTVLDSSELKAYLTLLKSRKPPIKARFIVPAPGFRTFSVDHWIAGEVDISENGTLRILLIDSLGAREPKTHDFIMTELGEIKELTIYISHGKRHITGMGCTVFSLKDVQDLFTIGDYLEPKYKKDIFEYVSQNVTGKVYNYGETGKYKEFPFPVYSALLPLRFMRSEQSKSKTLLDVTILERSKAEQDLPVNKKKETALQSSKKHFKAMNTKEGTLEVNMRIEYKLNKMAKRVLGYLAHHQFDLAKLEREAEPFTLKGLEQQMAVEYPAKPNATTPKEFLDKAEKEKLDVHRKEAVGLYFQNAGIDEISSKAIAKPIDQTATAQSVAPPADIPSNTTKQKPKG